LSIAFNNYIAVFPVFIKNIYINLLQNFILMAAQKYFIILSVFFLPLISIAQTFEIVEDDTVNYTDKNGNKQGIWTEYWDKGNIKYEVTYKNNLKEGVEMKYFKHAKCVEEESYYKAGKLEGTVTLKFDDCILKSKTEYKNGLKNGSEIIYHSNGNKASEANYVNDILQGTIKMYDKSGSFAQEGTANKQIFDMDAYAAGKTDFSDTVVLSVFRRNPEWKNKLIVVDLTAGMEPYSAQLIKWENMGLLTTEKRQYVFFNDGDNKESNDKIIGQTGGIYYSDGTSSSKLKKTIKQVIAAGNGGDMQENYVEALVSSLTLAQGYEQIILIADNKAPIRDMNMMKRLKKPVKIIVCGLNDTEAIAPDFLSIAFRTKGSIHTVHDDVKDLGKLIEGAEITIEQLKYKVENCSLVSQ
jgi:hypothetical protein